MDAVEIAHRLEREGKFSEAYDVLADLLEQQPDVPEAWRLLARLVVDVETSIYCWEQVAYLCPDRNTPRTLLTSLRVLAERHRQRQRTERP